jgi:hypothetical protein
MTDYRITMTVRNARILRAIEKAGFPSVAEVARATGYSSSMIYPLVTMKASPLTRGKGKNGDDVFRPLQWRPVAEKLALVLKIPVEDLFSASQRDPSGTVTRKSVDVSEKDIRSYIAKASFTKPVKYS